MPPYVTPQRPHLSYRGLSVLACVQHSLLRNSKLILRHVAALVHHVDGHLNLVQEHGGWDQPMLLEIYNMLYGNML